MGAVGAVGGGGRGLLVCGAKDHPHRVVAVSFTPHSPLRFGARC